MSILGTMQWLETTQFSIWLRESLWGYPNNGQADERHDGYPGDHLQTELVSFHCMRLHTRLHEPSSSGSLLVSLKGRL